MLAECIDASAEMSAQEALKDREELLRSLLEEMPDGLLQLDDHRYIVYHNARLLEILRVSPSAREEPAGEGEVIAPLTLGHLEQTLTSEAGRTLQLIIARALSDGVRQDAELETAPEAGEPRHIHFKVTPLLRENTLITGVIASVQDVTDNARARRELEKQASTDPLRAHTTAARS